MSSHRSTHQSAPDISGRSYPGPDPASEEVGTPQADHAKALRLDHAGRPQSHKPRTLSVQPEFEFPGCTPRRIRRSEIHAYKGRIEFWDADTETAWVCEPVSPVHERPCQALSALAERVATVRGSPITCYGSMDLLMRNARGETWRILEADQSVYLHPLSARLPGDSAMMVGEHDFPDVVLEVDHTTDVRPSKLGLYEAWGFPELWVQVPGRAAPSRPRSRMAGMTIHLLEDGAYRQSAASRAFPGWRAEEVHAALDETAISEQTLAVLKRVGLALGAREGTEPEDDPLFRWRFEQGRQQGMELGIRQGVEQGLAVHRESLRRMTGHRFDPSVAAELHRRLASVTDPASLIAAGDLVLKCSTGDELLDRLGTP